MNSSIDWSTDAISISQQHHQLRTNTWAFTGKLHMQTINLPVEVPWPSLLGPAFFFFSTGVWTQGLMVARQALCHLSHFPRAICMICCLISYWYLLQFHPLRPPLPLHLTWLSLVCTLGSASALFFFIAFNTILHFSYLFVYFLHLNGNSMRACFFTISTVNRSMSIM
jgi:hypothetical protein